MALEIRKPLDGAATQEPRRYLVLEAARMEPGMLGADGACVHGERPHARGLRLPRCLYVPINAMWGVWLREDA